MYSVHDFVCGFLSYSELTRYAIIIIIFYSLCCKETTATVNIIIINIIIISVILSSFLAHLLRLQLRRALFPSWGISIVIE